MTIYFPEATPAELATKIKAVLAVADDAAPALATEINAASSLEVTNVIRDWNPTVNTNTGQAPNRLGITEQMPLEGRTAYQPIAINYPYNPQGDDTDADNKAKALFVQGAVIKLVVRKGPDREQAFAVADQAEVWSVRCGRQNKGRSSDDEFAEYEISQNLYPIKKEADGVVAV